MNIAFETANPRLQNILSRLKGVKKVGPNTYRAYSPLRDEKEPSLYITEKSDGTILMCDHGGGDTKATLAAIGLTMCILFPSGGSEGSGPKGPAPSRKVAAIYKYLDKNGELVAEKVRYTNKNFFWRSKKPDGSYDYHKPENVPLYNGMVLEKAEAVFLVEGEKDVDTLTKHGLPAVSLPNGAHWENEYVAYFSDKVIIILPDNDDAGRGYAKAALKALMKYEVPIWEKYCLTLDEAAAYFGIGINKLREMTDDSTCTFVVFNGTKRLIKRKKLEECLADTDVI